MPSCFRLLPHCARRAASRADWTAGSSRAMSTAMIAITTSSSISVKPERRGDDRPAGRDVEMSDMMAPLGSLVDRYRGPVGPSGTDGPEAPAAPLDETHAEHTWG